MKKILVSLTCVLSVQICSARDLSYKVGAGFRQFYSNAFLDKDTKRERAEHQINGVELSYGISKDMQAGVAFASLANLHAALLGPSLRFDLHRVLERNEEAWKHVHVFAEAKFLAKFGNEIKSGITIHAPYLGIEILPFAGVDFAILTSGGLVIDFVEKSYWGITNSMFGDVGLRYYF